MNTNYRQYIPTFTVSAPDIADKWTTLPHQIEKTGQVGMSLVGLAKSALQAGGCYITDGYLCKENGLAQWKISKDLLIEGWQEAYPFIAIGMLLIAAAKMCKATEELSKEKATTPDRPFDSVKKGAVLMTTETGRTFAIALLFRTMVAYLNPHFISHFPPFNSQISERSSRWIKLGFDAVKLVAALSKPAAALVVPKLKAQFHYGFKGSCDCREMLIDSAFEQVLFQGGVQTGALKTLPRHLLEKSGYTHQEAEAIVNHRLAKLGRILVTSALFAVLHAPLYGHFKGMLMSQLTIGMVYATLRERDSSFLQQWGVHFLYNFLIFAQIGGITEELKKLMKKV